MFAQQPICSPLVGQIKCDPRSPLSPEPSATDNREIRGNFWYISGPRTCCGREFKPCGAGGREVPLTNTKAGCGHRTLNSLRGEFAIFAGRWRKIGPVIFLNTRPALPAHREPPLGEISGISIDFHFFRFLILFSLTAMVNPLEKVNTHATVPQWRNGAWAHPPRDSRRT